MRQKLRRSDTLHRHDLSLNALANRTRPILRGWVQYYGRFHSSVLMTALRVVDDALVRWAQQKYKRFRYAKGKAWGWLKRVKSREPNLFAHWVLEGMVG
jgi:hypothetical protein